MEQIIIKNLWKSYDSLTVLKNVDLTLDRDQTREKLSGVPVLVPVLALALIGMFPGLCVFPLFSRKTGSAPHFHL